jgi:hypothetical protein
MQASRPIMAFFGHPTRLADIAWEDEPDSRECHAVLRCKTIDDAVENVLRSASFPDPQRNCLKGLELHLSSPRGE